MPAPHTICRLCCDTVQEHHAEIISEGVRGMLQSVLTKIDLTVSENPVICNKCREKLETNYNFKRKCIFTEDSIIPFVAENVKLNLKEIRNQIIKVEDIDNDKNVCRLCLQFVDHDMTLSDSEKEQFQQFFPEINLSHTNFVILCTTCYNVLHKYFIFVTSCLELEQQLCNYSLDQTENKIDNAEEHVSIKLEEFQGFIKNIKEEDKELELNEELDIKCDTEDDDERYVTNYQGVEQLLLIKKEETDSDIFSGQRINKQEEDISTSQTSASPFTDTLDKHENSDVKTIIFKCEHCTVEFKLKAGLKNHILTKHTDVSKIPWYHCECCSRQFKCKQNLKKHVLNIHTDPSKISWHQCDQCDNKFKLKEKLKKHKLMNHTDPSKITWYQCEQCHKKFNHREKIKKHLSIHSVPAKITWHQCEHCVKKFKRCHILKTHVLSVHTDFSHISWHQCVHCSRKFKLKAHLKYHVLTVHADPSEITWYQCEQCDKKFKHKDKLNKHKTNMHSDPSKIQMYKCEHCGKQFKENYILKRHVLTIHTDLSKITWYKCDHCDKKLKHNYQL